MVTASSSGRRCKVLEERPLSSRTGAIIYGRPTRWNRRRWGCWAMPGVIHAKQFFASGGGKKMSEGFVGEGKGEYFGSRSRRDTARHPKAKKKSGRDSVLTTAVTPSKSPRFRSHNLWGEYDPEHPS